MCPLGRSVAIIFNKFLSMTTLMAGLSNYGLIKGVLNIKSSLFKAARFTLIVVSLPRIDTTGYRRAALLLPSFSKSGQTAELLIRGN